MNLWKMSIEYILFISGELYVCVCALPRRHHVANLLVEAEEQEEEWKEKVEEEEKE
jgi:hypothetical protein